MESRVHRYQSDAAALEAFQEFAQVPDAAREPVQLRYRKEASEYAIILTRWPWQLHVILHPRNLDVLGRHRPETPLAKLV